MSNNDMETYSKKKKRKAEEEQHLGQKVKKSKKNKEQNQRVIVERKEEEAPEENSHPGVPWRDEELKTLIERVEMEIPKGDSMTWHRRTEKLNWEMVKFHPYSAEDCYIKCKEIFSNIRKYRLLREVIEDAKVWVKRPWLDHKKYKEKKHPDMPSKPHSSYLIYFLEKRSKFSKKYPHLSMVELAPKIGEKYKLLSQDKKQKYVNKAIRLKEEYNEKMKQFRLMHPELLEEVKVPKVKESSPTGLTRPPAPFKSFFDNKMNKHKNDEDFNQKTFLLKCKGQWNKLSPKKKFVWIKWAYEQEQAYLNELKVYCAKNPDYVPKNEFKSVLTKEDKRLYDKMTGKPEKPPSSSYALFSRLYLRQLAGDGELAVNKMKDIAEKWKSLSNVEKQEYVERLKHIKENYKLEYASYLESLPEDRRLEELENNSKPLKKRKIKPEKQVTTLKLDKIASTSEHLYKGEPVQPPKTTKDYCIQNFMKENTHIRVELRATEAMKYWKNLSEKKKKKYELGLAALKTAYIKDYEIFLKKLNERELQEYSLFKNNATMAVTKNESDDEGDNDEEDDDDDDDDANNNDEDDENEDSKSSNSGSEKSSKKKKNQVQNSNSSSSSEDNDEDDDDDDDSSD